MKKGLFIFIFVLLVFSVSATTTLECSDVPGTILKCAKVSETGCVYNFDDECGEWDRGWRTGSCGRWYNPKESYVCYDDWQSECIATPTCPAGYYQVSSQVCTGQVCVEVPVEEEPEVIEGIIEENNTGDLEAVEEENVTEVIEEEQEEVHKMIPEEPVENVSEESEEKTEEAVKNIKDEIKILPVEEVPEKIESNKTSAETKTKEVSKEELKEYKVKSTNESVSKVIKNVDSQSITEVNKKVEENKEVYEVKSVQEVETNSGKISIDVVNNVDAESGEVKKVERVIKKEGVVFEEKDNEVIFVQEGNLVKVAGVDDKESKIDKMMSKSVKPLVTVEKLVIPGVVKNEEVILKVKKGSELAEEGDVILEGDDYDIVVLETDDLESLIENEDVLKIADETNQEEFAEYEEEILKQEAEEFSDEQKFDKSSGGVEEPDNLEEYLKEDMWEIQKGQESYYQQFVTPDEVKIYVEGLDEKEIYELVFSYVWVSDMELHGIPEKWMKPIDFLENSQSLERNPVEEIASDCEEQANTLVSMLRASGVSAKDVRVVLGQVNFSGMTGGHAWVEIKDDNKWMVLDPSLGPFYEEYYNIKIDREPVKYNYWKYHEYPIVEVWTYYNDVYFTDEEAEVADDWSKRAETALRSSIFEKFNKGFFASFWEWLKGLLG